MDASDWTYIAEGGKHAVFSYRGNGDSEDGDDRYDGRVLRVVKSFFHLACSSGPTGDMEVKPPTRSVSSTFLEKVIQPLLGPAYSDLPDVIPVPRDFMTQLYQNTMQAGVIPEKRLADWQVPVDQDNNEPVPPIFFITMLKDHSKIMCSSKSKALSIEIKPKAGFVTCTPFVKPQNKIRLQFSKFEIKQQRMMRGSIIAPWIGTDDPNDAKTRSFYCPLDLFSYETDRVQRSLSDLTKNMANNLRFWYEGEMIFGYGLDGPNLTVANEVVENVFPHFSENSPTKELEDVHDCILDNYVPVVSSILVNDPFLRNLKHMQHLNVVGDDGAVEMYKHFVSLFDGSNDEAEAFLDKYCLTFNSESPNDTDTVPSMVSNSPYEFPTDSSVARKICEKIESFRELAGYDGNESSNTQLLDRILDDAHGSTVSLIPEMNKTDCAFFLANWLLSLCVVDVSFFVTIQLYNNRKPIGNQTVCEIPVTRDGKETDKKVKYIYTIKVVDCDPKPTRHLSHRALGIAK